MENVSNTQRNVKPDKNMALTYILWFLFSGLGIHYFYLERNDLGLYRIALTIAFVILYVLLLAASGAEGALFTVALILLAAYSIATVAEMFVIYSLVRERNTTALMIPFESRNSPEENYKYGVENGERGKHREAIKMHTRAIELGLNTTEVYLNRGIDYYELEQYDDAISDFERAIELDSKNVEAYVNRGLAYCDKDSYDKAIADLTQAIKLNPNDMTIYQSRAYVYEKQGNSSAAEADYARAKEMDEFIR